MQLPVDLLHWLLAFLPILVLAFLLVQLRWTAQQAGAAGIFVAAAIAFVIFKTPLETLAVAGAKGVWDAVFILLVIWPALLLYQIMSQAGGYDALRQGITRMSRNELFAIVALGWVFASFLQGIDGFGTPIAIVAPLLVAFGVRPVYAVAIPIIGHIWALKPGEDLGLETHDHVDQFIRVEAGQGTALLGGKEHVLEDGSAVVIPAGVKHNIINRSPTEMLKLYTIYSPPEHPDGTMHETKAEAEIYEREHHR